eukprot:CAMPEP_0182534396 /NCGR_PEP_ID=MMETSP1323-20130603/15656_1 /TAXON_ID=236787 /ORGANISM="Florenciella parvula, Strain RCC1693" /LENGTH=82 /DNA_ID=CAMNT_0024744405 /DNA_START=42 /DNA_END=287 /DNA_ORIENTATION=-
MALLHGAARPDAPGGVKALNCLYHQPATTPSLYASLREKLGAGEQHVHPDGLTPELPVHVRVEELRDRLTRLVIEPHCRKTG